MSDNTKTISFVGGPKDGESIRMVFPPFKFFRTAIPEWCTYEFKEEEQAYFYKGAESVSGQSKPNWFD